MLQDIQSDTEERQAPPRDGRNWSAWIAALLVLALVGWMASGMLGEEAPMVAEARRAEEPRPVAVEATRSLAQPITRALSIEGEVDPTLATPVRAEAGGVVDRIVARKGARILVGEVIAEIAPAERNAQLAQAEADLRRAQRDFDAVSELAERGFATRARQEEVRSALAASQARLAAAEADVEDTVVRAPASGILNDLMVDPGEVIQPGAEVARIVDTSTLVVKVRIPQRSVAEIETGQTATVSFVTGQTREGRVSYLSANAEAATRTFALEVEVANPQGDIPAGISAEVSLPIAEVPAHFVSPAILSLGSDGALGVKTVGADDTVGFYPIDLVRAQTDGIWVSGLPDDATIITVGQGFVAAGERVMVTLAEPVADVPPAEPVAQVAEPLPQIAESAAPLARGNSDPQAGSEVVQTVVPIEAAEIDAAETDTSDPSLAKAAEETAAAPPSANEAEERVTPEEAGERVADEETRAPVAPGPTPVAIGAAENRGVTDGLPSSVSAFAEALTADSEAAVRSVQERLNALGFEVGTPTGEPNARTRLALAQFQEANGLETTGELGPDVLAALTQGAVSSGAVGDGANASDEAPDGTDDAVTIEVGDRLIREVQEALNARGFEAGPVDGILGAGTRAAIEAYQRDAGLSVTGELDTALLTSLDVAIGAAR